MEFVLNNFDLFVGFAALVSAIVGVAKIIGLPDGAAGRLAAGLNLAGLIGAVVVSVAYPEFDLNVLDAKLGVFAQFLALAGVYVGQLGLSQLTYLLTKRMGVPGAGATHEKGYVTSIKRTVA